MEVYLARTYDDMLGEWIAGVFSSCELAECHIEEAGFRYEDGRWTMHDNPMPDMFAEVVRCEVDEPGSWEVL